MAKAKAKPNPNRKPAATHVQVAGAQEQFEEAGAALAAELGWEGADEDELNDITVADARGFVVKTMHEHFQAAALGKPQPDFKAMCEHLAVDTPEELAAVEAALSEAYEAGHGAELTAHPIVYANVMAPNLKIKLSDAEEAAGKLS